MGAVTQLLAKHNVHVRRGQSGNLRQQGIMERFNRTMAEGLHAVLRNGRPSRSDLFLRLSPH